MSERSVPPQDLGSHVTLLKTSLTVTCFPANVSCVLPSNLPTHAFCPLPAYYDSKAIVVVVVVLVRTIAANNTLAETETACRYGLLTVYRMLLFQSRMNAQSWRYEDWEGS